MLIDWETTILNEEELKNLLPKINWIKKIRKVGSIEETWYRGDLEDNDRKIKLVIRPSMRMQVIETYKDRLMNGVAPKKGQKPSKATPFVDYGCSCQVLVSEEFVNKIDQLAKDFKRKPLQKISWS